MTPEATVKKNIDKILKRYHPRMFIRKPVRTGMGAPMLDYHNCYRGQYFAIEAKAFGKEPTEQQKITAAEVEAAGGTVFVITGADPFNETLVGALELVEWLDRC